MKEEFSDYLKDIGIIELFYDRSVEIFNLINQLINQDILDIFVSNYIDAEGKDNYQDMILFAEDRIIEAYNFLNEHDFYVNYKNSHPISGIEFKTSEYDFKEASDKSRLNCRMSFAGVLEIRMKASKKNCDYLNDIIKKHFL